MFGKIVFGLIGVPLGVVIIMYTRYIVEQITGPMRFAERYLGSAGTYTFVRFVGVLIFIVSLLVMFGFADWIYEGILNPAGSFLG
jgi:ABC-type lipoprotein release transport system permease subunit